MMFGTRDEFEYLECPECGSVQIARIPDLEPYYPDGYYSFETASTSSVKQRMAVVAAKAFDRSRLVPFSKALFSIGQIDARLVDRGLGLKSALELGMPKSARILDVGCGSAELLQVMARIGFTSLTGIDKFLTKEINVGIKLLAVEIADVEGKFDLIMFHHSLEHIPGPTAALKDAYRLLSPGGMCLVRIPLLNYAWEKYGINWVGLDAPRHLILMTEKTARKTAADAGFEVIDVIYDSTSFQFSASEKYSQDIPLVDTRKPFSRRQLRDWQNEAKRLNRLGRGDQAAFVLKKRDV
ncbi:MAG: class I SAM-dependent methyltransferase [bacterium]|nr:class I SAM-dependent methyltransferase [bacterium]